MEDKNRLTIIYFSSHYSTDGGQTRQERGGATTIPTYNSTPRKKNWRKLSTTEEKKDD